MLISARGLCDDLFVENVALVKLNRVTTQYGEIFVAKRLATGVIPLRLNVSLDSVSLRLAN